MKIFLLFFSIFVLFPIKSKDMRKIHIDLKVKTQILKFFNPMSNYIQQIEQLNISKKIIGKIKKMNIKFKKSHKEELFSIKRDGSKVKKVIDVELISLILKKKKVEFYYGRLYLTYDSVFQEQGNDSKPIIIPIPVPDPPPRFKIYLKKELNKYVY